MTNEEKAGQISGRILGFRDGKTQEIFNACMEMAEWKDSQMKSNQYTWHKISDGEPKKRDWYIVYLKSGTITSYYYETYDDMGFHPDKYGQYSDVIAWTEFPKYIE